HVPKNGEEGLHGIISNRQIYEAYPYPDKPVDLTIKGECIKGILEFSYSYLEFEKDTLKSTLIYETLCTFWQGFNYTVDMNQAPFNRVTLDGIDLNGLYRITMT
ncbi:5'-nucleotidase C-terminal domain-containing protein, partial [Staphylococcus intermedius]|uniref:5'-nucleotidase C-terminal domain-containing protein n=1 Tax=Staphylococcus intermedius TaxID=1285 RepID=UPI0030C5BFAF